MSDIRRDCIFQGLYISGSRLSSQKIGTNRQGWSVEAYTWKTIVPSVQNLKGPPTRHSKASLIPLRMG